ncbi:ComEC/Rec2 family competence protein [Anaerosporobacter faecicola]|uniref:ComEC/Rec2 family competence protein n=1 Tax=Anaerosporobacter faecicola TaxID=2718714 RepID=UPI00143964D0|nr:ComEC/Rec2 family competence protein [Anaerosporobacter faecicola]
MKKQFCCQRKRNYRECILIMVVVCSIFVCSCTKYTPFVTTNEKQDTDLDDADSKKTTNKTKEKGLQEKSMVYVHFLDVGKADCILIQMGEHAVLIDSGTSEKAETIITYLKEQNIEQLDYAVATHCDKDHVGGMSDILRAFPTKILMMSARGKNTKPYTAMIKTADALKVTQIIPEVKSMFYVNDVKFTVLSPGEKAMAADSDNESSLVLMMQYGAKKFLFMGDAMGVSEKEMMKAGYDLHADVIKVGHHGSNQTSSEKFLDKVNPAVAVITCEEGDGTDLPEKETLAVLNQQRILLYRTDRDGTIVMSTDGVDITIKKEK